MSKFKLFTPEQVGVALDTVVSQPRDCIPQNCLVATARGEAAGTSAKDVLDGHVGTKWQDVAERSWLQFEVLAGAIGIKRYQLQSACDHPEMDPYEWVFEGSDDGSKWTELDRQVSQVFAARCEIKSYPVWPPKALLRV